MVQLSHSYMTTRKTIALTIQTFVGKGMSLLFNMLTRFVITFLPRSKCLLISWLQSPPAVISEPRKMKSVSVSTFSPSICHEVMGPNAQCSCLENPRGGGAWWAAVYGVAQSGTRWKRLSRSSSSSVKNTVGTLIGLALNL